MRIVILADVHSNINALDAVLEDAGDCDAFWCAGDIVGYGPRPNECVGRLREMGAVSVAGNHDLGSLGKIDLGHFNRLARIACEWTGSELEEDHRDYLESLPLMIETDNETMIVHGSPREPVWEYVLSKWEASQNFMVMQQRVCFIAHSHTPVVFYRDKGSGDTEFMIPGEEEEYVIEEDKDYLINVGSVGQPRDGDPRACYVSYEYDERSIAYRRVEYDVDRTQEEMREEGLPGPLIERLSVGR